MIMKLIDRANQFPVLWVLVWVGQGLQPFPPALSPFKRNQVAIPIVFRANELPFSPASTAGIIVSTVGSALRWCPPTPG